MIFMCLEAMIILNGLIGIFGDAFVSDISADFDDGDETSDCIERKVDTVESSQLVGSITTFSDSNLDVKIDSEHAEENLKLSSPPLQAIEFQTPYSSSILGWDMSPMISESISESVEHFQNPTNQLYPMLATSTPLWLMPLYEQQQRIC